MAKTIKKVNIKSSLRGS